MRIAYVQREYGGEGGERVEVVEAFCLSWLSPIAVPASSDICEDRKSLSGHLEIAQIREKVATLLTHVVDLDTGAEVTWRDFLSPTSFLLSSFTPCS